LGLNVIYDQAKDYITNAEAKGKTGSRDNNTIGEITYPWDSNLRVDNVNYFLMNSIQQIQTETLFNLTLKHLLNASSSNRL